MILSLVNLILLIIEFTNLRFFLNKYFDLAIKQQSQLILKRVGLFIY